MDTGALNKLQFAKTEDLCRLYSPGPQAAPLAAANPLVGSFLAALLAARMWDEAVRVLAFGLPKRKAVWWACLCARVALGPEPPQAAAVAAAEAWVFAPNEDNRRTCEAAATAAGHQTAASWAAVAAFWSGGSLVAADLPAVPPGEQLTGTAVSGAVMLAAAAGPAAEIPQRYQQFLAAGIDIANGGRGIPLAQAGTA